MKKFEDRREKKPSEDAGAGQNYVFGRNSVRELFVSGRQTDKVFVQKGEKTGSITMLIAQAREKKIPVVECEKSKLDFMTGGGNHQGIVAQTSEVEYKDLDDILEYAASKGEKPLIVIADKIEDPGNLGALIRACECTGVHGVVIPKRNGALPTHTVAKASAGALEHVMLCKASNLASTVDELKKKGLWIFACEAGGDTYYKTDLDTPSAFIFGSEGNGVSRLLLDKSDFRISIPMYGKINSFNVSSAAAVILCEAAKQRRK